MTADISFKLYELFLPLLKEEAKAKAVVTNIEAIIDNKFVSEKDRLATKDDISEMKIEMKEQKSEIIKWMFIFWASQIAATIGFILMYIKK